MPIDSADAIMVRTSNSQNKIYAIDIVKLVSGTTIAQALAILASPIITRLYDPESFGLSALFISITSIISVVICLRYELAIMLPEKDEDAANILAISLLSTIFISILTVAVIWFGKLPILRLLNAAGLGVYLWLVPLSIFLGGFFQALNYWNSRKRHYGRLSIAKVTSSVATLSTQLGAGLNGYATGSSLIGAGLVGSLVSTLILGGMVWKEDRRILMEGINWPRLQASLVRYRRFPIYDSWGALLSTLSWQLPTFILSSFFSSKVLGYYSLGMMVLQLPTNLVGGSISQVFFQRAAKAKVDGSLAVVVEDTVLHLGIVGIFPILLLSLIGKEAFSIIFGNSWGEAGVYAQFLALWIFFFFITSPISTLFSVLEMQRTSLLINMITLPIRGGALIIGGMLGDPRFTILIFSAVGVIIYAWVNIWLVKKAGCSIIHILSRFSKYLACSMLLLSALVIAKWVLFLSPMHLIIVGSIAAIVYYMSAIKFSRVSNNYR